METLVADMNIAIEHLKNDPILSKGVNVPELGFSINFWNDYRNLRLNYLAAYSLKARMCLWWGTEAAKGEARHIATSLLANIDPGDGTALNPKFVSDNPSAPSSSDMFHFVRKGQVVSNTTGPNRPDNYGVLFPEVIFGFHNARRSDFYRDFFNSENLGTNVLVGGANTTTSLSFHDYLFGPGSVAGQDQSPVGNFWTDSKSREPNKEFTRFSAIDRTWPLFNEFMCIMRLGELYSMVAETAPDVNEKRTWLEEMRRLKGYISGNMTGTDEERVDLILELEFRKDTYGEGQYFFFAKRKNLGGLRRQNNTSVSMSADRYTPPLPATETDIRDR
jgi:hypothetical protein